MSDENNKPPAPAESAAAPQAIPMLVQLGRTPDGSQLMIVTSVPALWHIVRAYLWVALQALAADAPNRESIDAIVKALCVFLVSSGFITQQKLDELYDETGKPAGTLLEFPGAKKKPTVN
jgi:hypothetical protein